MRDGLHNNNDPCDENDDNRSKNDCTSHCEYPQRPKRDRAHYGTDSVMYSLDACYEGPLRVGKIKMALH